MNTILKQDGFQGQVQYVIPRPVLAGVAQNILVSGLYPTDIGWYPHASQHGRQRESGADQNILIICTAGQGWFEIDGKKRILQRNQALLVPKGKPHKYGAGQRNPWTIQWVHFSGDDAAYFFALLKGDFALPIHPDLTRKLDRLFGDAYELLAKGFSQQGVICVAQIVRYILGLLFFNNKAFSPATKTGRSKNLDRVIQYMKERIETTLTIDDMARQAGLSATHFSRLFSQQTGFPPMEYFIHLKIQRASRYLTLTRFSIKEISLTLGYSDQYYFSRIFHKVMGVSPLAYRQTQAG